MIRVLIPVIFLLLGTGGGVLAARLLSPPPEEGADHAAPEAVPEVEDEAHAEPDPEQEGSGDYEYVRLNNQFVVPVVRETGVEALVVLSLSLEVEAGSQQDVFSKEPKLRDAFLRALFDHANLGGFDGVYTAEAKMRALRTALMAEARDILGPTVNDVLIFDLVRQDS